MKLLAAPTTVPAIDPVDGRIQRAAGTLAAPTLDDASATASASLHQVASYVGMLDAALGDDPTFYERLVQRGFLDSAIDYARYAYDVIDFDGELDNDGFEGIIEGAVIEALLAARNMGTPVAAEPALIGELKMAGAAAANAATALATLAGRAPRP
jgi:hypothetical protein